jgi:hypothetical protein
MAICVVTALSDDAIDGVARELSGLVGLAGERSTDGHRWILSGGDPWVDESALTSASPQAWRSAGVARRLAILTISRSSGSLEISIARPTYRSD